MFGLRRIARKRQTESRLVAGNRSLQQKRQYFCRYLLFIRLTHYPSSSMKVHIWPDHRPSRTPRALLQRGRCDRDDCGQFAISISNGEFGITVRFESEDEFRRFLQEGELGASPQP
jgi:hypothetical protein